MRRGEKQKPHLRLFEIELCVSIPRPSTTATQIEALWGDFDKLARRMAAPKRNGKAKEMRS